jgi:hypothetical protein
MKKILFVLLCTLFGFSAKAQVKLESGLLIGGGQGTASNINVLNEKVQYATDYKFHLSLGYRFRIKPVNKKSFYDMDLAFGLKNFVIGYTEIFGPGSSSFFQDDDVRFYTSLALSYNYTVWKNLSIGAGIEPSYYLTAQNPNKFDVPLIGKLGYNFKFVEINLAYKYGFTDVLKSERLSSGKFRDWQITLYIPF